MEASLKIKTSIAQKLLTYVFSIYFIITMLVTFLHMYTDYSASDRRIRSQLAEAATLVAPSLSDSLWNYNSDAIKAVVNQIAQNHIVLGVSVSDDQKHQWRAKQVASNATGSFIFYDGASGEKIGEESVVPKSFQITHPLTYIDASGKKLIIGDLTIYSSSGIVLNDVKAVFFIILVNAFLKSLSLWFLFTYFGKRFLTVPLKMLSGETLKVASGSLDAIVINKDNLWPTEIDVLISNFSGMRDQLKSNQEKIIEIQARLSDIIDYMPSIIFGMTAQGLIIDWNNEAELFSSFKIDDAVGKELITLIPAYDLLLPLLGRVIENKLPEKIINQMVYHNQHRFYQDIVLYPIMNKVGEIDSIIVKIDDVTERINLERSMVQTEKMSSLGALAAGMAHEINAPLANIIQATENIARRIDPVVEANQKVAAEVGLDLANVHKYFDNRKISAFLLSIKESADKALKTLSSLLDFSNQSNSTKVACAFEELVDKALLLANSDYELKQNTDFSSMEILKDFEQNLPKIFASAGDINQVILNIVKVSCQSMNAQDKKHVLSFKLSKQDSMVKLELTDNGPGLNDDIQKKIFEPFFIPKSGEAITTGLGVSLRIINENHKGSLTLAKGSNGGLCFTLLLPIAVN